MKNAVSFIYAQHFSGLYIIKYITQTGSLLIFTDYSALEVLVLEFSVSIGGITLLVAKTLSLQRVCTLLRVSHLTFIKEQAQC